MFLKNILSRIYKKVFHSFILWRHPEINEFINKLNTDSPLAVYYIGARGGPDLFTNYLRRKKLAFSVGFEPELIEAEKLRLYGIYEEVIQVALGSKSTVECLYVTQEPGCSSLLLPDMETIQKFFKYPEWFNIKETQQIQLERLDKIAIKEFYPDVLQIDTQGYELEVLKGAVETIKRVYCLELEVHFYLLYQNQATFSQIHDFLEGQNFVLCHLTKQGEFGNTFVEANAVYYNLSLQKENPGRMQTILNYCTLKERKEITTDISKIL